MTKEEAYEEMFALDNREFSWDRKAIRQRYVANGDGYTPYQAAVLKRIHALHFFFRYNDAAPIARAEWEKRCPARDVTEDAETYFRNNYDVGALLGTDTWKRKMAEAGGKVPGFDGAYPDFAKFQGDKPPR